MQDPKSRRDFLGTVGVAGGCLMVCPLLHGASVAVAGTEDGAIQLPDFDKLTYCCYECKPEQCPTLKATLENDVEGKRKVLAAWKEKQAERIAEWEKLQGRQITVQDVQCYGCKAEDGRRGPLADTCPVRACVIERGIVSCAHCDELESCQQSLWVDYPRFREHVLGIRKVLLATSS